MATDIKLDDGDDGSWVTIDAHAVRIEGSDVLLDSAERRSAGGGRHRRALVHDGGDGLTINFGRDYPGGVTINSARLNFLPVSKLPAHATVGDLALLYKSTGADGLVVGESCSLWLCVPGPLSVSGLAVWRELTMGDPVRATE
jgi:hypothetical protein